MKDKSFIMLCTPGYIKKTGYYFRAERDKDVLQSLNFKEKGTIVINSLKKIINTVLLIKKNKNTLFICENIAAALPIALFFLMYKKTSLKVILVYHGSLEDLKAFKFYKLKRFIYEKIERIMIHRETTVLFVSNEMKEYYNIKYGNLESFHVSPNIPSDIFFESINDAKNKEKNELRNLLSLPEEKKIVCYCGNSQSWQKVELLTKIINFNTDDDLFFLILTRDTDYFIKNISKSKVNNTIIKTVPNDEVPYYLVASDMLYILRDNNETNRFSCPTKLVEYLWSQKPVLISENIGDFSQKIKFYNSGIVLNSNHYNDIDLITSLIKCFNGAAFPDDELDNYTFSFQHNLFKAILSDT
ncbi:hypothetical protein NEM87_10210 [Escherichia coli]|nr:hypothetical protein [Escherichia coli]HDC8713452.1 hypothetical protein [Escherichia coli]